jgi:S-adenosyl-L-methionine hydrolase (adenosine-forming)
VIVLFTDFGLQGPYTGQMKAVLCRMAPGIPAVDLFADAPVGNPRASAYLLAAYAEWFAVGTVFVAVVDPGVGGARPPIILEADGRWYVGPGNGLFELVERVPRASAAGTLTGSPSAFQRAFTGGISSHQSPLCSLGANHRQASLEETLRIAGQTGRTICTRSSTLITTAMP